MASVDPSDRRHNRDPRLTAPDNAQGRLITGPVADLIHGLVRFRDLAVDPSIIGDEHLKTWRDDNDVYIEIDTAGRMTLDSDITILNNKIYIRVSI